MAKLDQKFMRKPVTLVVLFLFIKCSSTLSAPVCQDVGHGGNPIAGQRSSATFTGATESSCQSGSPEYYVTNKELFQEIQFSEETDFCPSHNDLNTAEEDRVCDSSNLFRFTEHSDMLPLFIEESKQFLSRILLPASFLETPLSEEEKLHYQAIIYFCTRSFSNPLIKKVKSSALSKEERIEAFNELKRAGLLHMFSNDAQRLLVDLDLDNDLRKLILFSYLDTPELAAPFVSLKQKALRTIEQITKRSANDPLTPRMTQELQKHQQIASMLNDLFTNYVEAEHEPHQITALSLMADTDFPGAESATLILERKIVAASQNESARSTSVTTSDPASQPGSVTTSILHSLPSCTESNSSQISGQDYLIVEQLIYSHSSQISRSDINFNQTFLREYNSTRDWTSLIMQDESKEELFNKFFCFQHDINQSVTGTNQLSSDQANTVFQRIASIPSSISNLGALTSLLPYLSREEYLQALEILSVSSNNNLEVDEFKAQVLYDEFQRVTQNGSNLTDTAIHMAIIEALGQNSGFPADAKLAEIFRTNTSEELRMGIIQAYRNPAFARFGARLNIFHTLFEFPPEQRRTYAQALEQLVRDNYPTMQSTGGANNSSGSLSASQGQVNAAIAAVMTLNSDRTGNLNDGLEEVLTSDGEARIRTRRAPIARTGRSLLNHDDPPVPEELLTTNTTPESPIEHPLVEATDPFDAFNKILEDQRADDQTTNKEFIPGNEYLAKAPGEKEESDIIDTDREDDMSDSSSIEAREPFVSSPSESSPKDTQARTSATPSQSIHQESPDQLQQSTFTDPLANSPKNSNAIEGSYRDQSTSHLQREIDSLKTSNSELIGRIEKDNFKAGKLHNQKTQNQQSTKSASVNSASSKKAASRSIASISAPSVSSSLPSSSGNFNVGNPSPLQGKGAVKKEEVKVITEPLLSPRQELNLNEQGRVIKVVDSEEKLEFLNYMSAKNNFSCDEVKFIESFYKKHASFFFLVKQEEDTTLFANVEIDQMNYRFDYPGDSYIAQVKPEACSSKETSKTERVPASSPQQSEPSIEENEDETPVRKESIQDIIFNKFKDKFGL